MGESRRRWGAAVAAAAFAVVALGGCAGEEATAAADATGDEAALATVGEPAPDFTGTTADGEPISLAGLAGRPVWLTFGATWCASCRVEAPDMQDAHEATPGVEVVMVYLSEDAPTVTDYAQRLGTTFTHVPDPRGEISAKYHVVGVPVHWFVDADGVVRDVKFGVLSRAQMDEELAELQG